VKTGLGVALAEPGDRAILTYPGTIDVLTGDDLGAELVDACCHWHIASYFLMGGLRGVWPGWLRRMKTAGRSTSLDPNWDPQERWDGVVEVLPYVEVFLPNEVEAMAISGATCVRDAAEWLAARGPVVVVKRGANGVLAAGPGWRQEFQALGPPDLAETVADAVGAGDNFDAGFLRGWLLGWSIEDSVHLGQRCAARSLGGAGGIAGQLVMNVDEEQRR
jgi:sugar/nucleoside kinase (ribokinase family)